MKKQDKGFTLVELLIVIVILGILATVTVFAVRGITDRGNQNACDVEERALRTAIEAFYVDNNQTLPADITAPGAGLRRRGPVGSLDLHPGDRHAGCDRRRQLRLI